MFADWIKCVGIDTVMVPDDSYPSPGSSMSPSRLPVMVNLIIIQYKLETVYRIQHIIEVSFAPVRIVRKYKNRLR